MKIKRMSLSALLFGTMVFLALPQCLLAAGGANDPSYTVRKGDTLWDISRMHLKDPFLWPRIWKQNPKISDPDLIYPGQKLNLPEIAGMPAAGAEETAAPPPGGELKTEEPFVERGRTISKHEGEEAHIIPLDESKKKKQPIATESDILRAGFIARDLEGARKIAAGVLDDRAFFLAGDTVYVQDTGDMKVGDRFVSCRPAQHVRIPGTAVECGRVISVSGVVELTQKKDDYFIGRITESFSEVRKTDLLLPIGQPELVYEPVPRNEKLEGVWGYIFATRDEKVADTQGDVLYIGLGARDGVRPGDRFIIRRSGVARHTPDGHFLPGEYVLPDIEVGEAQVVAVQGETAAVKVMSSGEPVRVGYRIYYTY